ncbi:helix-turn-helix domain-containing protein [Rhizobium leguminosarum]|nr:helix-turn-helix domain-containing protein [Rhizobium leguminosarum]
MLSIAAVQEGMSRAEAARIGGMDRQTLRDWVHRFNTLGRAGLKDNRRRGNPRQQVLVPTLRPGDVVVMV